jgi:hypothetical protein
MSGGGRREIRRRGIEIMRSGEHADGRSLRIAYFVRIPNVGDRINPAIVSWLTSAATRFVPFSHDRPHLVCAGSIMSGTTSSSLVWGTGVMHPRYGLGRPVAGNIFAVRGRLSEAELRRSGLINRSLPLGDPGLLAPRVFGVAAATRPQYLLGLVPHYVDRWHPAVRRLLQQPGVCDLDVRQSPRDFLVAMANCAAVASSSLHGLVFAEALGLPSLWCSATNEVAGDGFKFHDWFSTTRHPQDEPYPLGLSDDVQGLVQRAEFRESTVVLDDLLAAFPSHRLDTIRDEQPCRVPAVAAHRHEHPLPVFVISFNRGAMLRRCLQGMSHLRRPMRFVIHDNGSTDPATLDVLAALEHEGVTVVRRPRITSPDELNGVNETVAWYFSDWGEPCRYVVTDCDIDMAIADPATLDVYDELLDRFRAVACVGPMLRIHDIPRHYPLYNRAMNRHIEQFWQHRPTWVERDGGRIAVQACRIDTSFALHRAGEAFERLKSALRVYEPYEARHLDWYADPSTIGDVYHQTSDGTISHWNNHDELCRHCDEPLRYADFVRVRRRSDGALEEVTTRLADPP